MSNEQVKTEEVVETKVETIPVEQKKEVVVETKPEVTYTSYTTSS